jgi:citrate lyase synthetase
LQVAAGRVRAVLMIAVPFTEDHRQLRESELFRVSKNKLAPDLPFSCEVLQVAAGRVRAVLMIAVPFTEDHTGN